ncbi:MAG: hypothetical protein KAW09_03050, partial [Thermoplasmata archaeon]|nr:hypothetical protein [Thermoplasmata archaeon]
MEEVRIDYLAYASEGSIETRDLAPSNWISWELFDASANLESGTNVSFWYSTDSGTSWTEIFAGENLQGVGLSAIRFRANLTTANGTRSPMLADMNVTYQFYGNLDHIHMSMAAWSGTTDETIDLDSTGHDFFHHLTPFTEKWETDDPWGSVDPFGLYSPGKVGTWRVYCNNSADSISNYTLVNIIPGSTARIAIDPWDPGTVTTDDNLMFNVTGYDSRGNLVGPVIANWSVAGGIGTIPTGPSSSALFNPTTPGVGMVGVGDGMGHTNITNAIQVVAGSRAAVGIEPWSPGILTTDEKLNFTAYAFDADGNQIATSTVFWSVNSSIGIIPPGPSETSIFEATTMGFGAISIDDGLGHTNTTDTIEVIEGILDSIVVQPDDISIHGGDYRNFTATGYDADGHIVPLISPVWQTNAGTITNSSSSGATFKAADTEVLNGWIRVTAIFQDNITGISNLEVVLVNVRPSILGPMPDQSKPEDYGSWSIDLSSYASDLQDPLSELTWSFTDHDTSLTTIYGDNVKGNHLITFSTIPNAFGDDDITAWLRDSDGYVDSAVFYIYITPVNDMPVIQSITPFTIHYDEPYSYFFFDYVSDVETQKEDLVLSSSEPDCISFDGLWGTFLYPEELNGVTVYPIITVHDEDGGEMPTMLAITISDDHVPVLVKELPDIVLDEGEEIIGYFNLNDYFDDPDEDSLFYSSGNIHTEITINEDHSVDFKAPDDWSGNETVSFRAMDPANARAEDIILVTVLPINDPPTISGVPDLVVHYDDSARPFYNYTFDLAPYIEDVDNDISDLNVTTNDPIHIFFNNSLNTVMEIHYPESMSGQVIPVRITVSDGLAEASQEMNITVLDNWPPEISSVIPDRSFFEDSSFPNAYNVADFFLDVDGDDLTFSSR